MSSQNPTIPTATQAKGIDAVILDLQTHLDFDLAWLTNGMGRAYRLSKVRTNQSVVFLPEVYLGTDKFTYFAATPDNDKKGQSIFIVGNEGYPNQQLGFYGLLEYDVSIIFAVNLKLIDPTLLETEYFEEHQIEDARESLIRNLLGKPYKLEVNEVVRQFEDVYSEFDVSNERGIAHAPMSYFRFNCTVTIREDCTGVSLNRCGAILQNLSQDDLLNCILPTYDFSNTIVQDATTGTQQADLTTWLCSGIGYVNEKSLDIDGINDYIEMPYTAAIDLDRLDPFTITAWIKISAYHNGSIYSKYANDATNNGFRFWVRPDGSLFLSLSASTTDKIQLTTTPGILPLNTWCHVAVSKDNTANATGVKFHLNGVLQTNIVSNPTCTASILNAHAQLIGNTALFGFPFAGKMTEFRWWGVEQSTAFILDDYNSGAPKMAADNLNSILLPRFGQRALFNDLYTNLRCPDDSPTFVESLQTFNMNKTQWTTDVPI